MKTIEKLMGYLLVGAVALFMNACNNNDIIDNAPTTYTLGDTITVNEVLTDPDGDPEDDTTWVDNPVTSTVTVEGGPTSIGKVTVGLNLTHTYCLQDVYVDIESPSGTMISLVGDQGSCEEPGSMDVLLDDDAEADINTQVAVAEIVGTYSPLEPLADFNGEDANGEWTLHVADTFVGDGTGELVSWSLNISPEI